MLGDAHGPGADDLVGGEIDLRRDLDVGSGEAGLILDRRPVRGVHGGAVGLVFGRVVAQKGPVEARGPAGGQNRVVGGEHRLGDASEGGHVAAEARLVVVARHRAEAPRSISTVFCGSAKRSSPRSRTGLKTTTFAPRWAARRRSPSMRGWLVPGFWPTTKIASAFSKSSSSTVPLPTPMAACSAMPLASWHMLEQSGKLLVP